MTRLAQPRSIRCLFAAAALLAAALSSASCKSGAPESANVQRRGELWTNSPPVCARDHIREYFCDELLASSSGLRADAPFDRCPAAVEHHVGTVEPMPTVALFDEDYTTWMRKRTPPGHSCCYSWCSPIPVVDASELPPPTPCDVPREFREHYCVAELEGGTSLPSPAPFSRCAAAVVPPEPVVYSQPEAGAHLDLAFTISRRQEGFNDCCYGWCVPSPPGVYLDR